ncbi:O-acyltransferase like protein-like isoform X2 [Leptopilina boulardi]|uniref:O-acyltransferase like protein-like isoform X2 n=1 Tax=Leptopilina boulardi TaxID=63433 RepID=UPI0021F60204|nr:O-acyltransferase like protein-like isoform X2 [Leptopilina boulardi]
MIFSHKNFSILIIIKIIIVFCQIKNSLSIFQNQLNITKVQNLINIVQQHQQRISSSSSSSSSLTKEIEINFSNPCYEELYQFTKSLKKGELWTYQMADATSKLQPGILVGNIIDLGMYDECLSINVNKNGSLIRGRHCMYSLSTNKKEIMPMLSICVPSICNATDINRLLNLIINNITDIHEFGIELKSTTCSRIDTLEWSNGSIIALSFIVIYVLILIGCTILDIFYATRDSNNIFVKTLIPFSLRRTSWKILNTKVNNSSIPVLNGIRVLSIAWVVMGHTYATRVMTIVNKLHALEWFASWDSIYMVLAPYAVDSFFTVSGFLMAYHFLKKFEKVGSTNIFEYYIHRYIRLTPAVGMLLVFTIFIVPHIGSGPLRESYEIYNQCDECWWTILLYLQNFINSHVMCLAHLWYLAVDMQLFWYSPIILYPLAIKPKIGLLILLISFIANLITTGIIIGVNEYSYNLMAERNMEMFEAVYRVPYTRAGPWLVGIFFGYLIVKQNIRFTKKIEILGWIGTAASFIFCTLGVIYCQRKDYKYNISFEIIFGSIARSIWGLGVSWIIYTSINIRGGPITKFLSLPIFVPLAKLSYCIYLVHASVQLLLESTTRVNVYFSDIQFISISFSDFILSIPLAFIFSLCFESPILVLEKMILGRKRKSQTELQNNVNVNNEYFHKIR